jgi:hypothetical protein
MMETLPTVTAPVPYAYHSRERDEGETEEKGEDRNSIFNPLSPHINTAEL